MDSIELGFEETESLLNPIELGEYLFLFNAVYRALIFIDPDKSNLQDIAHSPEEVKDYLVKLKTLPPHQINEFFNKGVNDISIKSLSRNTPMEWGIIALAFYALTAVILSGGEFSITREGGFKAQLPPLGTGIKKLKDALQSYPNINPGYGIKGTIIKLNKIELDLLMQQDPSTALDGGFQRFIIGLQIRVNKHTHELELSSYDLDRIFKYKKTRRKGGWQARFYKIFSRHFPDAA